MRPLVFYSIVVPEIRAIILQSEGFCQDIVQALVAPLQQEMKLDPTPIAHRTHGLNPNNLNKYDARIAAIDYTLAHDDGISLRNLDQAQVILLGVDVYKRQLVQRIAGCGDIIGMIIRFFAATHNNVAIRVAAGLIDGHLTIFVWREEHMAGAGCADSIHGNPRVAIGTIFKTYRTGAVSYTHLSNTR